VKRAFRLDPDDPEVVRRHAEILARREDLIAELSRYLTLAEGEPEEFRQSARETIGFYRALGDTPLWVVETLPERVEMRLRSVIARPGKVGGYLVNLRLNGKRSIRCLLDTGAVGLHLSPSVARKLGLIPVSAGTVFGGGGDQAHETYRALVEELLLGELRFRNAVAQVAERELDPTGRYAGILGVERLAGYRIEIDLKRRTLLLVRWPREDPVPEDQVEGDIDPAVAPPTRVPDPGDSLLFDVDGQLLLEAVVHRGQVQRPVLFLLDTGAARTYLDQTTAAELGPIRGPNRGRTVRSYGGQAASGGTLADLRVDAGPLDAANLTLPLLDLAWRSRLGGVGVDGYLGLDLLKGRKLVLDLRRGTIRLD
jgi:predicted aspartyl protease